MGTSIFRKFPLDSKFEGKLVLNMGCGNAKYPSKNVTNVDGYKDCNPDLLIDLEKAPFPEIPSNTYDLVLFNHILEHLHNWWACFEEGARALKPGGQLIVYVPFIGSDGVFGYRDHVSEINNLSFHGIGGTGAGTNAWAMGQTGGPASKLQLRAIERTYYNKWWIKHAPRRLRGWMGQHLRNVVDEEGFFFVKGGA